LYDVDIISPNVTEAQRMTARTDAEGPEEHVGKVVASDLIGRGAKAAVLKLGGRGCLVVTADGTMAKVPPFKVDIVDTTAAGDAFTAALAVGLARGLALPDSARIANAAGALACTKFGAQASMPTADAIRKLLAQYAE
jgi:ribokinase